MSQNKNIRLREYLRDYLSEGEREFSDIKKEMNKRTRKGFTVQQIAGVLNSTKDFQRLGSQYWGLRNAN